MISIQLSNEISGKRLDQKMTNNFASPSSNYLFQTFSDASRTEIITEHQKKIKRERKRFLNQEKFKVREKKTRN